MRTGTKRSSSRNIIGKAISFTISQPKTPLTLDESIWLASCLMATGTTGCNKPSTTLINTAVHFELTLGLLAVATGGGRLNEIEDECS